MRTFATRALMPSALQTVSWLAPFVTSSVCGSISRCAMLHFFLRVSPSMSTFFSSRMSMMTHFFPASLPAIFTQTLPISIMFFPLLVCKSSPCLLEV